MRLQTRILAAVTMIHGALGVVVATAVAGPLLAVDDLAYLSMGRTLAGGGAAPLGPQAPYGILYPGVLAPGWALGFDEAHMIVWARVVNAVLGALLIPVLYLLVRRVTSARFGVALGAAVIGASLPAALLTASIVWTERLLPLLVALAALLIVRLGDTGSWRAAAGAIATGVGLYATHPRMGLVALVVVAAVVSKLRRGGHRGGARWAAVVGLAGMGAVEVLRRWLSTATFGDPGTYDGTDLASRRGLGETPEMVVHALGTVAYLVLATAGLAAVGVVMLLRSRELRAWYLGMLGAAVVVAGWFLTGVGRSDAYLHGRYVEVMAPVLVALGMVGLRELAPMITLRIVVISAVVSGVYGAWAGPGDNWSRPRSPVMMLGTDVSGAPFGGDVFEPGAATSVALIVGLALIAAARVNAWLPPLMAAVAIAVAVASGLAGLDELQEASVMGQVQAALDDADIDRILIDTDRVPSNLAGAVAWQVGLDNATIVIGTDSTHVLLPADAIAPAGATKVRELGSATLWKLE